LSEQNKLFESTEPPNFVFSAPSRVAEVLGFECHYCNQSFSADIERVKHIDLAHLGKLRYPTREEFKNRLKPNRKRWAKNLLCRGLGKISSIRLKPNNRISKYSRLVTTRCPFEGLCRTRLGCCHGAVVIR